MKHFILPFLLVFVVQVFGQSTMNIHKTDGSVLQIPISEIDSVTYTIAPGSLFTQGAGVSDLEGHFYASIIVGNQEWMAENLNTSLYSNGDTIPNISNNNQWSVLTTGAWSYYNNDPQFENPYGKLYNWFTVVDARNVCPSGWHTPSDNEWIVLLSNFGGASAAGGKMKEAGIIHWTDPNVNADNTGGFTGLPGGYRLNTGTSMNMFDYGYWWSSVEYNPGTAAYYCSLWHNNGLARVAFNYEAYGLSVRCVKD